MGRMVHKSLTLSIYLIALVLTSDNTWGSNSIALTAPANIRYGAGIYLGFLEE